MGKSHPIQDFGVYELWDYWGMGIVGHFIYRIGYYYGYGDYWGYNWGYMGYNFIMGIIGVIGGIISIINMRKKTLSGVIYIRVGLLGL